MKFNVKYLSYLIIIISTLFGISLVSKLFASGIPLNIDLPLHYARLHCWEAFGPWSLVTSWCPWFQAGLPLYQSYAVLAAQLAGIFSLVFSLELSFKLVLVLIYFTLPISAFLLLNKLKQPLAGSFAYALLLFEGGGWHMGGFEQIFLVGMFAQAFGTGLLFLCLYLSFRFFEDMSNKNLVFLIIGTAALLLAHPVPFTLFIIYLIVFGLLYLKKSLSHYKKIIIYPLGVFCLSAFWFLPTIVRKLQGFYQNTLGGIQISKVDVLNYFYTPLNKYFLLLGIIGLLIALFSKKKIIRRFGIAGLVVPIVLFMALYLPSLWELLPFSHNIREIRLLAELRGFALVFSAFILGVLARFKFTIIKKRLPVGLICALLIFVLLAGAVYPSTKQKSQRFQYLGQFVRVLQTTYKVSVIGDNLCLCLQQNLQELQKFKIILFVFYKRKYQNS